MRDYIDLFFEFWGKSVDMLKKPMAGLVLFGMLIAGAFYLADNRKTAGYSQAKKDDSAIIATKDSVVNFRTGQLKSSQRKFDTLQKRYNEYDCAKESEKWMRLYQNLQTMVVMKKQNEERSLEAEKQRTAEIEKTLKSL